MRTNKYAFTALDAQVGFPDGDVQGNIALFPFGRAGGKGAVNGHGRYGHRIALEGNHWAEDIPNKSRGFGRYRGPAGQSAGDFCRYLHLVQVGERLVHRGIIFLHHSIAAFSVGLLDGFLDLVDRFVARQDAGNGEETGLHDRIDAIAHTRLFRNIIRVDRVELEFLLDDIFLGFPG